LSGSHPVTREHTVDVAATGVTQPVAPGVQATAPSTQAIAPEPIAPGAQPMTSDTQAMTPGAPAADEPTKTRSAILNIKSREVIPGGINSNFRKEAHFEPIFIARGRGGRLYDVDGREYIDLALSYGPAILGHSNEHLKSAIANSLERLYSMESTELEQQAARKIAAHVRCAEQVRFACSGTEANYFALRVARAHTGRDCIVRFAGHYHGGSDELLGGVAAGPYDSQALAAERDADWFSQMTHTAGRARSALCATFILEWNDLSALEELLRRRGDSIAAVIMEPVMINNFGCLPLPGYLQGVRDACTRHGVVLIFDEVLTGFRMSLGGAQAHFGVTPDLATFAKALGGGFPVSAFCGRRELMQHITSTEVVAGGTYNGHPLMMAAVIATIEELERDRGAALQQIAQSGARLKSGLDRLARAYGEPLLLQGFPGSWTYSFTSDPRIDNHAQGCTTDLARAARFNALLKKHGVLSTQRLLTCAAHTDADIDAALERAEAALKLL
jgi:glutamate-1-semialdehyde 2,1-aminomutase